MNPQSDEGTTPAPPQTQQPVVVQLDPKCLHSALKEFFDPLRTNDSRTDFFATYRRESEEFDRDYAKKYDEDLNTSLIFAGLFSAVSSAFIIDVQSKLEPDPNDMTAAYMRILINAVNNSLFPDVDLDSATWTGPPLEMVTVQSLLYASLATSLFAAFIAMLGKQWVNRYIRNHGGSAAEKSRDRQRKLDGFKKWHFYLAIESLPVMLQLALLLLGCALSLYLWTISRTVSAVILTFTLFGLTSYVLLSLAATLYYDCPYQTPPSILTRAIIGHAKRSNSAAARSLRSLVASLPSIENLGQILRHLHSGVHRGLQSFGCIPTIVEEVERVPLAVILESPVRTFENTSIDWEVCKADVRCISWMFESTTDPDVILSTVRFAADMTWYPEIAVALSPHVLADLLFDCISDRRVIPGKLEHATSIGMALASVLSVRLNMRPGDWGLWELCNRIQLDIGLTNPSEQLFSLVARVLRFLTTPLHSLGEGTTGNWRFDHSVPNLTTADKLWWSKTILQAVWMHRRFAKPETVLRLFSIDAVYDHLMADGDETLHVLRTNCFLISAIALGLEIDFCDLYAPSDLDALEGAIYLFHHQLLQVIIKERETHEYDINVFLSAITHLNPFQAMGTAELGFIWITKILDSRYPEDARYQMASRVVRVLGNYFFPEVPAHSSSYMSPTWTPPLLNFLLLCEKFYAEGAFLPHPGFLALRILSIIRKPVNFVATALPVLASTLLPTHPLQSRGLALEVFHVFVSGWLSPQMRRTPNKDLGRLLRAVGDPFQHLDPPFQYKQTGFYGQSVDTVGKRAVKVTTILMEFASLDLWRDHLRRSNFTSCEETVSTEEGKRAFLCCMLDTAENSWPDLLHTPSKITTAIMRLEELHCSNTAEVMIMWAWTVGVINPVDRIAWKLILDETLRFYRTHGFQRLVTLARHITDTTMEDTHGMFLGAHYQTSPFRMGCVRRPVALRREVCDDTKWNDRYPSQACQLRKLYQLVGYVPPTWEETVTVEEVDEETRPSSKYSVTSVSFADWACNHP